MAGGLFALGIVVGTLLGFAISARRFERRRRREGKWNAEGPIDPTWGPPNRDLLARGIRPPAIEREEEE